jgi:hypothetical protein
MPRLSTASLVLLLALAACSGRGGASSSGGSTAAMTEAQVNRLLRDQGYADIANLHREQGGWEANATRGGSPVTVEVDTYGIIHLK